MNGIPCFCPWEISIDARLDVVRNMHHLLFAIQVGLIAAMHLGTPCTSFTRARMPQLRLTRQPRGPLGLPTSMQDMVEIRNTLSLVSCPLCVALLGNAASASGKS